MSTLTFTYILLLQTHRTVLFPVIPTNHTVQNRKFRQQKLKKQYDTTMPVAIHNTFSLLQQPDSPRC